MFKKIAIGSLILIAGAVITAFATNCFDTNIEAKTPVSVETVSTSASMPEHCEPSDCSPEKAAACPYSNSATSTSALATENANCPGTKDCPPSKCNPDKSSGKVTL